MTILKRYKMCPFCKNEIPLRSKVCPHEWCREVIQIGPTKPPKKYRVDWKELREGDKIELFVGDFYRNSKGEAIPINNSGKYEVIKVEESGLLLYNSKGYSYQNMVRQGKNEVTGVERDLPVVKKIKQGDRV